MNNIADLITWATKELAGVSGTPRLDSEILLSFAASIKRLRIHSHPEGNITPEQARLFRECLTRRKSLESIAVIIGSKEFFGLDFLVNKDVLIPRPDTELLVELAIKYCENSVPESEEFRILDLGTGSGCISIALSSELVKKDITNFHITALDVSQAALRVAADNAAKFKLSEKITFLESNWFSGLNGDEKFKLILSNPPYIAEPERQALPDISREPEVALFSGREGFDDIKKILSCLPTFLDQNGRFLCEIDPSLRPHIEDFYRDKPLARYEFHRDPAGHERVLSVG